MDKSVIRREILNKRGIMSPDEVTEKSKAICEKFCVSFDWLDKESFLLYSDFKNEVITDGIISFLVRNGKRIYLPVVDGPDIVIAEYNENAMKTGAFGISEPDISVVKNELPERIDVFVVPGIAFDCNGGRIGFGKGYYDRTLCNSKGVKVALCYDFQVVENAYANELDVPMDYIVTEERIIEVHGI